MTYLDVGWTCGGVAYSIYTAVGQLSDAETHHQDSLLWTAQSLRDLWLQSVAQCATHPPNFTAMMSFTRLSSTLVLLARNTETKRPGYEAVYLQQRQLNNTKHNKLYTSRYPGHWTIHSCKEFWLVGQSTHPNMHKLCLLTAESMAGSCGASPGLGISLT